MSSSEQKLTSPCPINGLADESLANIFKHLPPYERLLVSEVSKRWYGISRLPWSDVYHLDLSSIPGENIGPVVKQCPNLRTLFARDKDFSANQLHILASTELSSLKLYRCSSTIPETNSGPLFSAAFSDNLPNTPCKNMVLCDFYFKFGANSFRYGDDVGNLPTSLERLQLKCVKLILRPHDDTYTWYQCPINGLGHLHQLTCLSVQSSYSCSALPRFCDWNPDLVTVLRAMKNLRELCVGGDGTVFHFGSLGSDLPRLEVLFLNNLFLGREEDLQNLATKHPALRILCVTGSFDVECTIPERRLYPNGFGADPVPKLHVFVGKQASEQIVFTKSPADGLQIHPITEPLPQFLEKEEIAPLFEGVWVAAQIKEGAKHGSNWWKYEGDTATSFRTADDA